MTEPNRHTTPVPSLPNRHVDPWKPNPALKGPGIFTRDTSIPPTTPGASFIEALRHLADSAFDGDWFVECKTDDAARVWCSGPERLDFHVAIHRPTSRLDDYVTTVDHLVTDSILAAPLERILRDHRELVTKRTALLVGYVHKPPTADPFERFGLQVGIGNRWPVAPASSEENRIAEFVVWNIQVILWLREEARSYLRNCPTAITPPPPLTPEAPLTAHSIRITRPASPSSTDQPTSSPVKSWESILHPQGWDPFDKLVPWVGLASPAVFQPLAFDIGYWFEFWTQHGEKHGRTPDLVETVRRSLALYLGSGWRIEYHGYQHHILRHETHPWSFVIREQKTIMSRLCDRPRPFRISTPGGPYCPTGDSASVTLICQTPALADAVAREVCDHRAGTASIASSFFADNRPGEYAIHGHVNGFIGEKPVHPWRFATPSFDGFAWWNEHSTHHNCTLKLQVIWALKILHTACLTAAAKR